MAATAATEAPRAVVTSDWKTFFTSLRAHKCNYHLDGKCDECCVKHGGKQTAQIVVGGRCGVCGWRLPQATDPHIASECSSRARGVYCLYCSMLHGERKCGYSASEGSCIICDADSINAKAEFAALIAKEEEEAAALGEAALEAERKAAAALETERKAATAGPSGLAAVPADKPREEKKRRWFVSTVRIMTAANALGGGESITDADFLAEVDENLAENMYIVGDEVYTHAELAKKFNLTALELDVNKMCVRLAIDHYPDGERVVRATDEDHEPRTVLLYSPEERDEMKRRVELGLPRRAHVRVGAYATEQATVMPTKTVTLEHVYRTGKAWGQMHKIREMIESIQHLRAVRTDGARDLLTALMSATAADIPRIEAALD